MVQEHVGELPSTLLDQDAETLSWAQVGGEEAGRWGGGEAGITFPGPPLVMNEFQSGPL